MNKYKALTLIVNFFRSKIDPAGLKNTILLIPLVTFLSACAGSGGGTGNSYNVTYGDLLSEFESIRKDSTRTASEEGYTSSLPISGIASYAGAASFSEHARPQIIAKANLDVDFSSGSISGTLSDFRGDDGAIFEGEMRISDGWIDRSDSSIAASIDGHLTSNSARMSTVDATGDFAGYFIGDNHRYIRGSTSAIWVTNSGTGTEEHITMGGELATVKQY